MNVTATNWFWIFALLVLGCWCWLLQLMGVVGAVKAVRMKKKREERNWKEINLKVKKSKFVRFVFFPTKKKCCFFGLFSTNQIYFIYTVQYLTYIHLFFIGLLLFFLYFFFLEIHRIVLKDYFLY